MCWRSVGLSHGQDYFLSSTAIIALIGIIIGSASASRIGSATDRFTSAFAVISSSFPVWWIGMLMILLFAFALIFPARATPDIAPGEPGYYLSLDTTWFCHLLQFSYWISYCSFCKYVLFLHCTYHKIAY